MPFAPLNPKPNQLQVPSLITPMLGGTATPSSPPPQQLPNMVESALNGIKITQAAIASKQQATAAAMNAAISRGVEERNKNLLQLFKEIEKGKNRDGTPYSEEQKLGMKNEAATKFGVGWDSGQGSVNPTIAPNVYGRGPFLNPELRAPLNPATPGNSPGNPPANQQNTGPKPGQPGGPIIIGGQPVTESIPTVSPGIPNAPMGQLSYQPNYPASYAPLAYQQQPEDYLSPAPMAQAYG